MHPFVACTLLGCMARSQLQLQETTQYVAEADAPLSLQHPTEGKHIYICHIFTNPSLIVNGCVEWG